MAKSIQSRSAPSRTGSGVTQSPASKSEHTPGPWRVLQTIHAAAWIGEKGNPSVIVHAGPIPATTANARLIAAAPDLFAALGDIARVATWNECATAEPQIRMSKADISNALDFCITQARAAIAKATGESV